MSKFLNLVENNLPPQDLDKNREVLRELQQLFSKAGITSSLKTFKDIVTITMGNKSIDLQLSRVTGNTEEEAEDDVITGLLNTNDANLKNNAAALGAKKKLTNAVVKVANNVTNAVATGASTTPYR